MAHDNGIRENEVQVTPPEANDAGLIFIGRISTPWTARSETPRQGSHTGPICRIEIFEPWVAALKGVETFERLEILYWLHQARRDLVLQSPPAAARCTAPSRCAPLSDRTRSARPSWFSKASRAMCFWCAAWIASTARRFLTSSPTGACSSRSCRRSQAKPSLTVMHRRRITVRKLDAQPFSAGLKRIRLRISNSIWAPACAVLVVVSYCGATSTTSPPTKFRPFSPCRISSA